MKTVHLRELETKIVTHLNTMLDQAYLSEGVRDGLEQLILIQDLLNCCEEEDGEDESANGIWYTDANGDLLYPVSTTGDIPA